MGNETDKQNDDRCGDKSRSNALVRLPSEVTQEMLNAAMKEAVKLGIFPKYADEETYLKHWGAMESILNAAIAT